MAIWTIVIIEKAFYDGIKYNVYNYDYIVAYLTSNFDIEYKEGKLIHSLNQLPNEIEEIKRDLSIYDNLIGGINGKV